MQCKVCHNPRMTREERNTPEAAEVLYVCRDCGASTKRLTVRNPYAPEQPGFSEPPAVGEWAR